MRALGERFDFIGRHSVVRGLPWSKRMTYRAGPDRTPVNLTGCNARFVIGDTPTSAVATVLTSSYGGGIALGGGSGVIDIDISAGATQSIAAQRPQYWFYLTDALGNERLLMYGRISVVEGG